MDKKRIVLIIPYRGIGDLIFHIPLIRGLFKSYNSKIDILTNSVNKAKFLLRNEKYVKNICYLSFARENQIKNSYNFLRKINTFNSDLAILTAPSKRLIIPLLLSNSKKKIYFKKNKIKDLSKYIISQSKKELSNIKIDKNYTLSTSKPYIKNKNIFFSIDSRHDSNNWDKNNFLKLIKKIKIIKSFHKIYINFDPSKITNFSEIIKEFKNCKKIVFTHSVNFQKLINLINSCKYIIGNESGPICIGASLNKKVFSIYYPKHTHKSSKTINKNVKFFNSNIIKSDKIISDIIKSLN